MKQHIIVIKSSAPPTVEIDSSALSAYVRFKSSAIVRTQEIETLDNQTATIDFDKDGEVVGVELIGVREFSIKALLRKVPVTAPKVNWERARYLPAGAGRTLIPV